MSYSQVLKTDVEVTDLSLPIFNPNDGWLTPSTLMLYDFRRPKCYPSQLATPPNGTPAINLVATSGNATLVTSASGMSFTPGKITMTGAANNTINYGANAAYDLVAAGSPDFVALIWFRIHADRSVSNSQGLFQKGTTAANVASFTFHAAYNGTSNTVNFAVSNGTNQISISTPFNELDTWVQIGFAFEGGKVKIFKNGVLAAESATSLTKPLNTSSSPLKSFGTDAWLQFKGDVSRVGLTKLDEGKTALERIADDWSANRLAIQAIA